MSLETLLEAARYVEQQEKKRARAAAAAAAAAASVADHSHGIAPHSNQHNSAEPRGAKLKRERAEQDDLFCEEKMLIIDEEEPLESNNRTNGNYHHHNHHFHPHHNQQQQQHHHYHGSSGGGARGGGGLSPSVGSSPPSAAGCQQQQHLTDLTASQLQHHNEHDVLVTAAAVNNAAPQYNHYLDNHNSNHSQNSPGGGSATSALIVDVETVQDSKKPRNGPCVIRSGTREVHNKLEKNRRAHLKECFELLKRQLPSQDEKKSSNLSILHAAIRHIQALRRKERDYEHEMERLAREKITAQQRLVSLKKELAATWDHIDFSTLLPEPSSMIEPNATKNASENMEVDGPGGLARGGTRYSSTSSLSSAATASSPQTLQAAASGGSSTSSGNNNAHSQAATAAVVCQTQGLNLAQSSRESPPASSSPGVPTPAQEKVTISSTVVQQQSQQQAPTQLHLPISAQVLNTSQGLATIMPTLQHLGPGLRVIPGDARQLIAVQSNAGVGGAGNGEARPVALVVHSTAPNSDNRVTFVHSTSGDRPLALAVQSSGSDVRPVTFVSGNEARPIVIATTHASAISVTNAQTRIRTGDAVQTTHKMVGGVALVGGNGSELARLPGGAELNILPANGVFRSVKGQPLAVQGGLTLSHAGISLQSTNNKSVVTTQATTVIHQQQQQTGSNGGHATPSAGQHEGLAAGCHLVASGHQPLAGLTPIVAPMTVVSQGSNQVILAPSSLAGKMIGAPLLKSVGQSHLPLTVNAQYLNSLVKPVVVVSSNHQQQQQQQQQSQQTTQTTSNSGTAVSSQSAV